MFPFVDSHRMAGRQFGDARPGCRVQIGAERRPAPLFARSECLLTPSLSREWRLAYVDGFSPHITTFQASQRTAGIRVRMPSSNFNGVHHHSRSGVSRRILFQ